MVSLNLVSGRGSVVARPHAEIFSPLAVKKRRKKSETDTYPRGACSAPNAFWYKKAGRGGQIGRRYIRKAMLPTNIVWYEVHNIRYNQLPHNRNF